MSRISKSTELGLASLQFPNILFPQGLYKGWVIVWSLRELGQVTSPFLICKMGTVMAASTLRKMVTSGWDHRVKGP